MIQSPSTWLGHWFGIQHSAFRTQHFPSLPLNPLPPTPATPKKQIPISKANSYQFSYAYCENNGINHFDPLGLDYLDCLSACITDNDPLNYVVNLIIGLGAGLTLPKCLWAEVLDTLGYAHEAGLVRASATIGSKLTTMPSVVANALRIATGTTSDAALVLRAVGEIMSPAYIAYGVAILYVEAYCASYCFFNTDYNDSTGDILSYVESEYFSSL